MFRVQVFAVCKFWPGPRSVSTDVSGLEPCQGIGAGLTDGSAKHRICQRLLGSKSVTDAKKINSIQFNSVQFRSDPRPDAHDLSTVHGFYFGHIPDPRPVAQHFALPEQLRQAGPFRLEKFLSRAR